MSKKKKKITIIVNDDGTIEIDQIGWKGKDCHGAIQDLINSLGKEVKITKKSEWNKKSVEIRKKRTQHQERTL